MSHGADLPLGRIICGDNCEVMRLWPSQSVDLVVTSPPYDDLRTYSAGKPMNELWDFYGVAWNLKRLLKSGGVLVWVVADATKDGSETGTSMEQALYFKRIGLNMHDTMIWHKPDPNPQQQHPRYQPSFEYMFVFCKGYPPKAFNPITCKSKYSGTNTTTRGQRNSNDTFRHAQPKANLVKETKFIDNVWNIGKQATIGHPAPFPFQLARDHIATWSHPGDIVLDPFAGSGTTLKAAQDLGRQWVGIEINPDYIPICEARTAQASLELHQ